MFDSKATATPKVGRACSHADREASAALAAGPGPRAAELLAELDASTLSGPGRIAFLQACEQLTAWVSGLSQPVLATHVGHRHREPTLDQRDPAPLRQAALVEEVRVALALSEPAVQARVEVAQRLCTDLPLTRRLLSEGQLSFSHARAVVESARGLDEASAGAVEERACPGAVGRPVSDLRRRCRAEVDRIDPEAAGRRHRDAHLGRQVRRYPLPDAMACLEVTAAAHDVEAIWQALTVLAGPRESDDPRTLGARRVDALLAICLGAVAPDGATATGGSATHPPVQAQVVVDLPTLLGLADHPAELRGYGPIPAGVARDWLADATTWRRLVVDPVSGHLLDYGPEVRFAPPRLRAFVTARDQRCTFPGCRRPALASDLDHEPVWRPDGRGGRTSARDLAALCRRHHRYRTERHWQVVERVDGDTLWVSPSGLRWQRPPPPVIDTG